MLKYASAQIMTADLAPKGASRRELRRFAHRHHFKYEVRPGYLYVRSRAISSRCNDNFDEFPAEELEKSYASFVGKPVFVNHVNHDHKRARGVIIDAALHKDANRDGSKDWWVEVLMEVDAVRFPRLAKEILAGNIARTSMGCDVAFSVCSACGNKATTPAEYCQHIPGSKGIMLYRRTASGQKVGEIIRETCYGLKFFENSLLVEPPADPTAAVLGTPFLAPGTKLASRHVTPRPTLNDASDDGVGDSVLLAEGSVRDRSASPTALPLGEKVGHRAYLPHGLIGEFGGGVGNPLQAPEPLRHVPGVLGVGAENPVVGVVAQRGVAGVPNDQALRNLAHQGRVAPSVGTDGAALGVVQGQAAVPVLEGATGPQPAVRRAVGEGDLGQVARKNARKGPHEVHSTKRINLADLGRRAQAMRKKAAWSDKEPIDYDEIGRRWKRTYGDPEIHGETANPDGPAIGDAANHLAHDRPDDPDAEGSSVWDLKFHREDVDPYAIDHASHNPSDGRVARAAEGYRNNSNKVPPLLLVHRHGVYQVADGHHRAAGAKSAGLDTVRAYVAYSPHEDEPFSDGSRAPFHGAEPSGKGSFREAARKTAYGEQKAPMDVDTLREDACPVCGDRDTFDGDTCEVCGYVAPPKIFQDPDLEKARQMDLRKDVAEFQDPANPNQIGPDGQPVQDPMDPSALDADGNPMDPDAQDPSLQPGGLPGEVPAEVQTAEDGAMDPNALGPDGQPLTDETGAPLDPSMLGPDGQPLQGQQMTLPDGTPIGPQVLPDAATTNMGQPFTPGPNMPEGPGEPEGPEGPATPEDLDEDGQPIDPDAGQGAPGTPEDGVPDLMCPNCGFTTEATPPTSIDMDTQELPNVGMAQMDGAQAGDVCPNCGSAQLLSPAEVQGQTDVPMPV